MKKLEIKMVPIDDIKPYAKNPRKNETAIEPVMASIKQFGFRIPMVLDKNNVVVCGHTRLMAARRLEMTELPCVYVDDLTDEQVKAFRLVDNRVAESEWDNEVLEEELEKITGIDMKAFGFVDLEIPEVDHLFEDKIDIPVTVTCQHCGKTFEVM